MTKQEQIDEMAVIGCVRNPQAHTAEECAKCDFKQGQCNAYRHAERLYSAGYRKIQDGTVVLSREEYEMLKSLYDTQKGAIMTSSIGDLPLTVEGLRKAVDEITRLNRVETELQELNAKYYNEAKDLRRELKQTRKETTEALYNASHCEVDEIQQLKEENACLLKACEEQFTFDTTQNKKYSVFNSVRKEFAEKLKEKALLHCRTINCYECKFIETTIDELLEEYEND